MVFNGGLSEFKVDTQLKAPVIQNNYKFSVELYTAIDDTTHTAILLTTLETQKNMKTAQDNCPICYGDGYITETHDADSFHREHCPCSAQRPLTPVDTVELVRSVALMDEMVENGYAAEQDQRYTEFEAKEELWQEMKMLRHLQPFAFTADDLRRRAAYALKDCHHNTIGACFKKASTLGLIEATGDWVASTSPSAHGRHIRVWRRK